MAVGAQQGAGEVEEPGLPQKPDGISGGDPVTAEIFGVPIAGHRVISPVEGTVHLGHEVGVHQIVCVKDKIPVVDILSLLLQAAEQVVYGIALALVLLVKSLIDKSTRLTGRGGSVVGAVVRHHKNIQFVRRIILRAQALDQFCNHRFFVARSNQGSIAPQLPRRRCVVLFRPAAVEKAHQHKGSLIGKRRRNGNAQQQIKRMDQVQHRAHILSVSTS